MRNLSYIKKPEILFMKKLPSSSWMEKLSYLIPDNFERSTEIVKHSPEYSESKLFIVF